MISRKQLKEIRNINHVKPDVNINNFVEYTKKFQFPSYILFFENRILSNNNSTHKILSIWLINIIAYIIFCIHLLFRSSGTSFPPSKMKEYEMSFNHSWLATQKILKRQILFNIHRIRRMLYITSLHTSQCIQLVFLTHVL